MKTKKQYCYAVKVGRVPGIYETWDACRPQVDHYPNARYQKFLTREEAQAYLDAEEPAIVCAEVPQGVPAVPPPGDSGHYDIYTDGSYETWRYSWAFVVFQRWDLVYAACAVGEKSWGRSAHNVTGELEAVINGLLWAEAHGATSVTIHHDFEGVSKWASGDWKAYKRITQDYADFIQPRLGWVKFKKVKAHSGIEGNELADKLAKEALSGSRKEGQ